MEQGQSAARYRADSRHSLGAHRGNSSGKVLPNQHLIFSEVSYLYQPIVGYVVSKAGIELSDTTYTRPRKFSCVTYPTPPLGTPYPPCPTD